MSKLSDCIATKPSQLRMVVGFTVKNGKVLLGLRKQVSLGLGKNIIGGIGGKVGYEPGLENETDEEALIRETQEEVGIILTMYERVGEVNFYFPYKPKWHQHVLIYINREWTGEPVEQEKIKPMWYEIDKIPLDLMWDDNKYWVPLVLAGKKVKVDILYGEDNKTAVEEQVTEI